MKNSSHQRVWLSQRGAWGLIESRNGLANSLKRALEKKDRLTTLDVVIKLNNIFVQFPNIVDKAGENARQRAAVTRLFEMFERLHSLSTKLATKQYDINDPELDIEERLVYAIHLLINRSASVLEYAWTGKQKIQFNQWLRESQVQSPFLCFIIL